MRRWRFRKFAMRRIRSDRFALLAGVVFLVAGASVAQAQYSVPALAPPGYPPAPAIRFVTDNPTAAEQPGAAKPDGMTKLYEPCLTCNRLVRYGHHSCKPHKGCFQKPTLFEWSVGCDPKEKNGNGNGKGNGDGNGNGEENSNGNDEPEKEDRL